MHSQPPRWSMLLAVVVLAIAGASAEACPTCSQALADDRGGDLIAGFFWSIVFMMSMPFVLVSALGLYFYLQVRKARAAQASAQAAALAMSSCSAQDTAGSQNQPDSQDAELVEV